MKFQYLFSQKKKKTNKKKTEKIKIRMSPATNFAWRFKGKLHNIIHLFVVKLSYFIINEFLAYLNNVHGELLYYPWWWRHRRPQMLKFSLKFLRPHYFLTLSLI